MSGGSGWTKGRSVLVAAVTALAAAAAVLLVVRPWDGDDGGTALADRVCWGSVETRRVLGVLPEGSYEHSETADTRYPSTDARCTLRLPDSEPGDRSFAFYTGTLLGQTDPPFLEFGEGVGAGYRTAGVSDEIIVADHQAWTVLPRCHGADTGEEPMIATVIARDRAAETKPPESVDAADHLVAGRPGAARELVGLLADIVNGLRARAGCDGPQLVATDLHGTVEQTAAPGGAGTACGADGVGLARRPGASWAVTTAQSPTWSECVIRTAPDGAVVLRYVQLRGVLANLLEPPPTERFKDDGGSRGDRTYIGATQCGGVPVIDTMRLGTDLQTADGRPLETERAFLALSETFAGRAGCAAK
ncbi:hypothetical protein [Streptodolium elevatio]